jgi:hypothetical protein
LYWYNNVFTWIINIFMAQKYNKLLNYTNFFENFQKNCDFRMIKKSFYDFLIMPIKTIITKIIVQTKKKEEPA